MKDRLQRMAWLWAGIALGGSILAAPAKFQVENLPLDLALQVGRVQFLWVSIGELACIVITLIGWTGVWMRRKQAPKGRTAALVLLAMLLFAIQHLGLMPFLQARSERIIAGETVEASHLHLVYMALEGLKFLCLLLAGSLPNR